MGAFSAEMLAVGWVACSLLVVAWWLARRTFRARELARSETVRGVLEREFVSALGSGSLGRRARQLFRRSPHVAEQVAADLLLRLDETQRPAFVELARSSFLAAGMEGRIRVRRPEDYRRLLLGASLGLPEAWAEIDRLLRVAPGNWRWVAGIHALAYWPGGEASRLLVDQLERLGYKDRLVERAFVQPLLGAISTRGREALGEIVRRLRARPSPRGVGALAVALARAPSMPDSWLGLVEDALRRAWSWADAEGKARILEAGVRHRLLGLVPLAQGALHEQEEEFVRLWAVRLLAMQPGEVTGWMEAVRADASEVVRQEALRLLQARTIAGSGKPHACGTGACACRSTQDTRGLSRRMLAAEVPRGITGSPGRSG